MTVEEQRDLLLAACKSAKHWLREGKYKLWTEAKRVSAVIEECQAAIDAVEKPTEDNQAWFDSSGGSDVPDNNAGS